MKRSEQIISIFNNAIEDIKNDWRTKDRELYITKSILNLDWIEDGTHLVEKKKTKDYLKKIYLDCDNELFTTIGLPNEYYFIHEPFGPKRSPDYLFITPKGFFGGEDKTKKSGNIEWNTGTPGENKFICFYDRKDKKIYLLHGLDWGWTREHSIVYNQSTVQLQKLTEEIYKRNFVDKNLYLGPITKMFPYHRRMLLDRNKIKDIYDKEIKNVKILFEKYLD